MSYLKMNKQTRLFSCAVMVVIAICLSQLFCYYIYDEVIHFAGTNIYIYLVPRLVFAMWIYLGIDFVVFQQGKFSRARQYLILGSYLIFLLSLTLKPISFQSMNLDVSRMAYAFINSSSAMKLLAGNVLLYIPLGCMVVQIKKLPIIVYLAIFILYICSVEYFQYVCFLGVCDINDVILNTIGFSIGVLLMKVIRRYC